MLPKKAWGEWFVPRELTGYNSLIRHQFLICQGQGSRERVGLWGVIFLTCTELRIKSPFLYGNNSYERAT